MSNQKTKKRKKLWIWLGSIFGALILLFTACVIYLSDYYKADDKAIETFLQTHGVTQRKLKDGAIAFEAQEPKAGLIFYPGGKVEDDAYIPLLVACAEKGVTCILVEMPFRLAVFDVDAADGLQKYYPDIENWYMGGHSLGGSMAAKYISEHKKAFTGLILLAAYSTEDLSNSHLKVLSVYGSEDEILNAKKYRQNKSNLPKDFQEIILQGGNHAQFGYYGKQDGDGKAAITPEEQILLTAQAIASFV